MFLISCTCVGTMSRFHFTGDVEKEQCIKEIHDSEEPRDPGIQPPHTQDHNTKTTRRTKNNKPFLSLHVVTALQMRMNQDGRRGDNPHPPTHQRKGCSAAHDLFEVKPKHVHLHGPLVCGSTHTAAFPLCPHGPRQASVDADTGDHRLDRTPSAAPIKASSPFVSSPQKGTAELHCSGHH